MPTRSIADIPIHRRMGAILLSSSLTSLALVAFFIYGIALSLFDLEGYARFFATVDDYTPMLLIFLLASLGVSLAIILWNLTTQGLGGLRPITWKLGTVFFVLAVLPTWFVGTVGFLVGGKF